MAAISIDTTSHGSGSVGTTVTVSHTCNSANLLVVLATVFDKTTVPTMTYNGTSMTRTDLTSVSGTYTYSFSLASPTTGPNNIVLTKGSGIASTLAGISFLNAVGTDATTHSTGSGTSASQTLTTNQQTGFVFSFMGWTTATTITYTASGTEFATDPYQNRLCSYVYSSYSGGDDVTETWTETVGSHTWGASAIEIYGAVPASGFLAFM